MLQALVNGKAGRVPVSDETVSWRSAFRMSEDLLTASVFGRLVYLEGSSLWRILKRTFGSPLPDLKVAELVNVEFWPRWEESGETGRQVEPDVVLDFDVGDPVVPVRLIVEAKLGSSPAQYADQWTRQWAADREANPDDGRQVFLAAIGGLGRNVEATAERIASGIVAQGHDIRVVAAGWDRLLDAIEDERSKPMSKHATRVLDDMITALGLASYQRLSFLGDMKHRVHPWRNLTQALSLNRFE